MHFADLCGHEQRPDGVLDVTAELSAKRNEKRKMTKYQIYVNTSLQSSQLSEEIDSRIHLTAGILDVTAEVVGDMLQSEILRRVDSRLDREDGQQVVEPISHPARTTDRCWSQPGLDLRVFFSVSIAVPRERECFGSV